MVLNEGCPRSKFWGKIQELPRRIRLLLASKEVRGDRKMVEKKEQVCIEKGSKRGNSLK